MKIGSVQSESTGREIAVVEAMGQAGTQKPFVALTISRLTFSRAENIELIRLLMNADAVMSGVIAEKAKAA